MLADPELDPMFEATFAANIMPEAVEGMEETSDESGEDEDEGGPEIKAEDFLISFVEFESKSR